MQVNRNLKLVISTIDVNLRCQNQALLNLAQVITLSRIFLEII